MRYILLDYAKANRAQKRGGGGKAVTLDEAMVIAPERTEEILALEDALCQLEKLDPQQAKVVELRFFAGLGVEETAEALGISTATVKREWAMARAWLHSMLDGSK